MPYPTPNPTPAQDVQGLGLGNAPSLDPEPNPMHVESQPRCVEVGEEVRVRFTPDDRLRV